MRNLMAMVQRLGATQSSVMIEGESGVGKEVVAQALHQASRGPAHDIRPFIAVHCAALPETLLESELFGYERGAFTGAERQMIGRLELADGGTLFLDEVGEIPLSMQVKLLRVLEQRELTRVGGRQVIKVNFRLIAATNRNLDEEVAAGRFREDLYYRLNVVRLTVPALRERREDILPLFRMFLARFAAEQGQPAARLTPEIEALVLNYAWPGNVRELRNLAERLSIFASGRDLIRDDIPANILQPSAAPGAAAAGSDGARSELPGNLLDLEQLERLTIEKALNQFNGNRSAAAEALGISRRTLQRKLKEYKMAEEDEDKDEA
jgi:DNA-binding NtrC family response regulator